MSLDSDLKKGAHGVSAALLLERHKKACMGVPRLHGVSARAPFHEVSRHHEVSALSSDMRLLRDMGVPR